MDPGEILSNYTYIFILIMIRYNGLFLLAPVLGSRTIPTRIKIGLTLFLTVITLPVISQSAGVAGVVLPESGLVILLDILRELAVGFVIGYLAYLPFAAIQLAGRFIDMRMGFAIVNVTDPVHGETMPMIGQFKNILAVLLFLGINGHHLLLRALYLSFEWIPLRGAGLSSVTLNYIIRTTGNLFLLALEIALPVIAVLFVADIILGFLARTIPQLNIFIVGLPVKILVGFVVLTLALHSTMYYVQDLFANMYDEIINLIKIMA